MRISDWSSDVCSSDLLAGEDAVGAPGARGVRLCPVDELEALAALGQITILEGGPDVVGGQFAPALVGDGLDDVTKARLHFLGQLQSLVLFEYPGDAALARLAVDADHRFIAASQVGGINGQIDRKSTRLNTSHSCATRMTSSA